MRQQFFSLKIPKEYEQYLNLFQKKLKKNLVNLPKGKMAGIIFKSCFEGNHSKLMREICSEFSDIRGLISKDLEHLEREEQKEVEAFIRKLKNKKQNTKNV